jgi:hypothetical protein
MYTTSQIQELILEQTGIKTSVKKGKGSVKHTITFSPILQNGIYPEFPFEWRRKFISQFPDHGNEFSSANGTQIHICIADFKQDDPIFFKREKKAKPVSEMSVKQWGSANSQIRLDKTAARYAKKRRGPNGDKMVKYW